MFLTPYRNGLYVLCAPADPVAAEDVRAADVASVLKLLADQFDAVIVDTGAGIGEHTVVATETATDIILVASMDVPSVRNLRKALDILDLLGVNEATRHLVVNRADSKVGLGVDDVSAAAGLKPNVELPSARIVPISLNEGRPVVISHPRSPITRRIRELAETIGVQPRRRSR